MSVSIYDAKTHLSQLIAQVEATGEEIVIRRHNVPVAKLVPFRPVAEPRRLGRWAGHVVIHDDFDALPAEVAAAFAGERP
jgi:prevent-host-death family protein